MVVFHGHLATSHWDHMAFLFVSCIFCLTSASASHFTPLLQLTFRLGFEAVVLPPSFLFGDSSTSTSPLTCAWASLSSFVLLISFLCWLLLNSCSPPFASGILHAAAASVYVQAQVQPSLFEPDFFPSVLSDNVVLSKHAGGFSFLEFLVAYILFLDGAIYAVAFEDLFTIGLPGPAHPLEFAFVSQSFKRVTSYS